MAGTVSAMNGTGQRETCGRRQRRGQRAIGLGAAIALAAIVIGMPDGAAQVATASGDVQKVEHAREFQVVRMPFKSAQLVVYLPTEISHPSMTGDSLYLKLDCFTSRGFHFAFRRPWPTDAGYHFHMITPRSIARTVKSCRLSGPSTQFEATVVNGPRDGSHPRGPPSDPDATLNPLGI
jgi:hypothetical protein